MEINLKAFANLFISCSIFDNFGKNMVKTSTLNFFHPNLKLNIS